MRNLLTILRRELSTYFNSPIGYIFILIFAGLNLLLFQVSFSNNPSANMRSMFQMLPFIFCAFIPLVSMRLWAEDRKENTIEMLLTLPMQPYELVLGKYLASVVFLIISLAGTISIPFMLGYLGFPDWGVIFSSYLGALLLGSLFLAVGIFISGLVKDQIVAAVFSMGTCMALYLLGIDFIVTGIDSLFTYFTGMQSSIGKIFKSFLATTTHYEPFMKGIIPFASVMYFFIWIGLFLFLNGLFLEGRNRRGYNSLFAASCVLCLFIGIFTNYLFEGVSLGRLDFTENKIHTVSPATKKILSSLDGDVRIKLYISRKEDLPIPLQDLEQQVDDKLEEMRITSGGKMKFSVVSMRAERLADDIDESNNTEESLEKSLIKKGVKPFQISLGEATKRSTQLIFSSLGVTYMENKEEFIPQVVPQSLEDLEYQIMSILYRQTQDKKKIAFVAPPAVPAHLIPMYRQMGQQIPPGEYDIIEQLLNHDGYEATKVDLTKTSNLPEDFDVLVMMAPRELNDRQKWEIARALHNGKNVFLAVQNYQYEYRLNGRALEINRQPFTPNVNDWLSKYGVTVDEKILMDKNSAVLTVQSDNAENPMLQMFGLQVDMPTHIILNRENIGEPSEITSRIDEVVYLWGSALEIDNEVLDENKLSGTVLLKSSSNSWKLPTNQVLTYADREPLVDDLKSYPLMILIEGQFADYLGSEAPEWPKEENNPNQLPPMQNQGNDSAPRAANPKQGKLLLIGCANMFNQSFLSNSVELFRNSLDVLATGGELSSIRSKKVSPRTIGKITDGELFFFKLLNYGLINLLIIIAGLARLTQRRYSRDKYTMSVM